MTVMDAVAVATEDVERLYPLNEVPAKPTYPYGTYSAAMGRGDTYTLDDEEGVRWLRVVVQTFGKTATSALGKAEAATSALKGTRLAVDGYETTRLRVELDPAVTRDPDDKGVVGVTTTLTATATRGVTP